MINFLKEKKSDFWDKEKPHYGSLSGDRQNSKLKSKGAKLKGDSFKRLKLNGFDFSKADLRGVSFREAELENIYFTGADLRGVSFQGSILKNVKIDRATVGVTSLQRFLVFWISCLISFLSSVVISYSFGLSLYVILLFSGQVSPGGQDVSVGILGVFISIILPLLFIVAAVLSLDKGPGKYFSFFFLVAIILCFVCIAAIPSVDTAAAIFFDLASFVGVTIGLFSQSQATYALKEISYLYNFQNRGLKIALVSIYAASCAGVLLGICAFVLPDPLDWSQTDIFLFVLALYLLSAVSITCIGHRFGFKAYEEKESYRLIAGRLPDGFSLPRFIDGNPDKRPEESDSKQNFKDEGSHEVSESYESRDLKKILESQLKKFVDKTVKERKEQEKFKFSIIRFLADLLFDGFKTNFLDADLSNVTFNETNLNRANFSQAVVSFVPSEKLASDEATLLEQLKLLRQAILERTSTVFNIFNNISNSTIGGNAQVGDVNVSNSSQTDSSEPSQAERKSKQNDERSNNMASSGDGPNITTSVHLDGGSVMRDSASAGTVNYNAGNTSGASQDPEGKDANKLKQHLQELTNAISAESDLPDDVKDDALQQVKKLSEALQAGDKNQRKLKAGMAFSALKNLGDGLTSAAKLAESMEKLLPLIGGFFGLA